MNRSVIVLCAAFLWTDASASDVESLDSMNRYPAYNGAIAARPGGERPRDGEGPRGAAELEPRERSGAAPSPASQPVRTPQPSSVPKKLPRIAQGLALKFDNAADLAPMAERAAPPRPTPQPAAPPAQRPGAEPAMPSSPPPKISRLGISLSRKNNNPGNLMYADWEKQYGAVRGAGNRFGTFAKFPTVESGFRALRHLMLSARFRDLTLAQAMNKHAPYVAGSGNDPQLYAKIVARDVRVPQTTRVRDLSDEQMNRLLLSIQQVEGWH